MAEKPEAFFNLQNIPLRTPLGHEIRRGFACMPRALLDADFATLEARTAQYAKVK